MIKKISHFVVIEVFDSSTLKKVAAEHMSVDADSAESAIRRAGMKFVQKLRREAKVKKAKP